MSRLKHFLNLHFFQALLESLVVLLVLVGHCLPTESQKTDEKHNHRRKRGLAKNYIRVDTKLTCIASKDDTLNLTFTPLAPISPGSPLEPSGPISP